MIRVNQRATIGLLYRWSPAYLTMAMGLPAIILRLGGVHTSPELAVAVFGLGILSAAFLLGAASEASQHDIPASLSLAVLAFVAVLPEYAVDLLFAWRAGNDPEQAQFAIANMTGANRLLLGIGWSFVLFAFIARNKWIVRRPQRVITLPRTINLELAAMGVATLVAFTIPLVGNINLIMSAVLLAIFGWYLFRLSRQAIEEPNVGGPAALITDLPTRRRRIVVVLLFAYAGAAIVASAEPFADGLIELGESLGIDEFILVQWLAPLASESPEFSGRALPGLARRRAPRPDGAGIVQGQSVHPADCVVADRLRDQRQHARRSADGLPPGGGGLPHRRSVDLRRAHPA